MIIYPIIQLSEGQCISVSFNDLDNPEVWHGDPLARAAEFVEQGAEWLHVTDFDAARGRGENTQVIERIIRDVGIPVQVAGGIRSDEHVAHWIDVGAGRLVIGTNAIRFPDWVRGLAHQHPDQIVVAIDVWEGKIVVDGWRETSAITPREIAHAYEESPLAAMILADIDRHLDMPESGMALTTAFAAETRTPVLSSGLVRTRDDVSTLRYLPDVAGVLIGRALYDRSLDLSEVIEIARAVPEPVAHFQ